MRKITCVWCLGALMLCLGQQSFGQCKNHVALNKYERAQFVEVSNGKRERVLAQYLSATGCSHQMLDALSRLGATIEFADIRAGYALALTPRDKLLATLDIAGMEYAFTRNDERWYYQEPAAQVPPNMRRAEPVPAITIPYPHVAKMLPTDGPYFASDEVGLTELWKEYPKADGRGVRVAVPDEGFDLLHPALQQARDAAGNVVPKVADIMTVTSPEEDSDWVRFGELVRTKEGKFQAAGRTWTAPDDGAYRFGIFKHDVSLGPEGNSHTRTLSLAVGVLWNEKSNQVWVDTDGDGNFENQRALRDFAADHDIDWFGTIDAEQDNRVPFGIKIDRAQRAVYIRIGGGHGAFVGGALAANELTGGLFVGTAPSAQLIDSNSFRSTSLAEMMSLFARPDVDVINRSGGIGRALAGIREGREDFAQRVLERAITVYDKPIACYCAAAGTIHVEDYAGPEMLRRNRQLGPPYLDTILSGLPFVPNGLVNTVLAPSANLETESRYMPQDITWEDGKRHNYSDGSFNPPAPDGYVIGANNSPAIPVVSGILADLIAGAKWAHVRYNAQHLNNAIFTGTRLLVGFPASQQGYGLINAANSWNQLVSMAKADDPKNPELTSFAITRMESGRSLVVNGFYREVAKAGEAIEDELWITRHGGYEGERKYTLALRGNDGSYTLHNQRVSLTRDKSARVRFRMNGASGFHVAFLQLRDTKANTVMQEVPLSVRVPDVPQKLAPGVESYQSIIPPLHSESRFVRVDREVQAVRYLMRIPYTGPEIISTRSFPGGGYRSKTSPPGVPVDAIHHVGPTEELESLVANEDPGTQEIFWQNRGSPEYATFDDGPAPDVPIKATMTVAKYAVAFSAQRQNLHVTNRFADVEGKVELYDAKLASSSTTGIGTHASADVRRTLPAHLSQWRVAVSASSLPPDSADAFLLNCTAAEAGCSVAAQEPVGKNGATLVLQQPQEGAWRIVIRTRSLVDKAADYQIREALLVPSATPIDGVGGKHASGATWTIALPAMQSDAQYAAFRISGTPGNEREKDGVRIALTSLDNHAP